MSRRTLVLFGAAGLAAAALVWLLTGGEPASPEARVRAALDSAVEAAEAQDLGGVLDVVSDRFHGRGYDKDRLKGMLFVQLRRGSWRKVVLTGTEVTLASPTVADVRTSAVLARGEGLAPTNADRWDFGLTFEREDDGAWRIVRAEWKRAR